ncbi:MAG: hypothetical protein K6B41_11285 [Butyrivibrio sp.]|nr:hypothetical protein [Butyrivibrio sp.]
MNCILKARMLSDLKGVLDSKRYVSTLKKIRDYKPDYGKYLMTVPVEYSLELLHLPEMNYDECCALLTALACDGRNFRDNYYNGYVLPVLERMIDLQRSRQFGAIAI